ncbi:MAG: diacylglycerol kinase [Deltaproteobacteria bacterium]|nr:diacylglycerol kinase [Deltaproteobacteria bacterium]
MSKKLRVIQFGTGFVGHFALRAIIEHPDMELVGCWVYSDDKVGVDAGDIAGTEKTGIITTSDIDALLALNADCLCSGAGGDGREQWMADAHCRFLEAGVNIVSSSIVGMVDPDAHPDKALHDQIESAALKGGVSYFTSGIEPGFMSDTLPLTLTGVSQYWKTIRTQEILDYSTYIPNEADKIMGDILGFGRSMDYEPILFSPGRLTYIWGGPVTLTARGLGVELDEVREVVERWPASESFEVEGLGTIEKGTCEAFHFEVQGIVDGEPVIVLEHFTRLRSESAPEWEQGEFGQGYYIHVEGDPDLKLHIACTGADGDHHSGGILATGTRLVNAIPSVCSAKSGLISTLDLPLLVGHNLRK